MTLHGSKNPSIRTNRRIGHVITDYYDAADAIRDRHEPVTIEALARERGRSVSAIDGYLQKYPDLKIRLGVVPAKAKKT